MKQRNHWRMQVVAQAALLGILMVAASLADDSMPGKKSPSVAFTPVSLTTVVRGQESNLDLHFRVGDGFHINSNTPTADFLIPTALKFDTPTDIVLGKITYPQGEEKSFPFAPDDKLSVYSGDFTVTLKVHPLSTVAPGNYEFHGQLKYQACDNAACYPPKQVPVNFQVKVIKAPPAHHANPAQSPHVHN
jgi:hypothetical protein